MELTYAGHALMRLRERDITKEQVEVTVRAPTGRPLPGDRGRTVYQRPFGSRTLCVVVDTSSTPIAVVSAYWKGS